MDRLAFASVSTPEEEQSASHGQHSFLQSLPAEIIGRIYDKLLQVPLQDEPVKSEQETINCADAFNLAATCRRLYAEARPALMRHQYTMVIAEYDSSFENFSAPFVRLPRSDIRRGYMSPLTDKDLVWKQVERARRYIKDLQILVSCDFSGSHPNGQIYDPLEIRAAHQLMRIMHHLNIRSLWDIHGLRPGSRTLESLEIVLKPNFRYMRTPAGPKTRYKLTKSRRRWAYIHIPVWAHKIPGNGDAHTKFLASIVRAMGKTVSGLVNQLRKFQLSRQNLIARAAYGSDPKQVPKLKLLIRIDTSELVLSMAKVQVGRRLVYESKTRVGWFDEEDCMDAMSWELSKYSRGLGPNVVFQVGGIHSTRTL